MEIEFTRLQGELENFIPPIDDPDLHNIFCDKLDAEQNIEIIGAEFSPSDILQKMDANFFNEEKNKFRNNLEENYLVLIPAYQNLLKKLHNLEVSIKKNNQNEITKKKAVEKITNELNNQSVFVVELGAECGFGTVVLDTIDSKYYFFLYDLHVPDREIKADLENTYLDDEKNFLFKEVSLVDHNNNIQFMGCAIIFEGKDHDKSPLDDDFKWPIQKYLDLAFSYDF